MPSLQTYYRITSTAPNAARTIGCKACNSSVEYPSREYKHDIKESKVDMVNPIFKENGQGRKHPGSCAFAEQELLSYRKPKHVVQNEKNGNKIPIIVTTIMMKIMMK